MAVLREWAEENYLSFCWLSGWTDRPNDWYGPWWLQEAHVQSGAGQARRIADDMHSMILLCPLAHQLHVSSTEDMPKMTINGAEYPTIDAANTLWILKKMNPTHWDLNHLETIWIGSPPTPRPPHPFWLNQMFRSQGLVL